MSDWAGLLVGVALLVGNAFFVGAEFAIISARRSQIEPLSRAGNRRARITLRGMERVSLMLAGAQLGITVCSLGLGAVAEPALAHAIEPALLAIGLPTGLAHPIAFAIALSIVVYLHIVLGEMVPKNLALAAPEPSALWLSPVLWAIVAVLRPFIWALNALANAGLRLLRVTPKDEVASTFTSEEVATIIAESEREGLLDAAESTLASGALDLAAAPVAELVIPVASLRSVPLTAPASALLEATSATGFSRFPVVGSDGLPMGYLHVRDVLRCGDTRSVADLPLRSLPIIAAGATAASAAEIMRRSGTHLAQVVRPDGTLAGILALEDVLEELIGEVRDAAHRGS